MIPVLLASPYAGDVERHVAYALACVRDSIARGEAPLAPHLLYPQALDDADAAQRAAGIAAGLAWGELARRLVVYTDLGISRGMAEEMAHAWGDQWVVEERRIGGRW